MSNLILGGLMMSERHLHKYVAMYTRLTNRPTSVLPFSFLHMGLPPRMLAKDYNFLKVALLSPEGSQKVHLHAMSGSCHVAYNLFRMYPDLKSRVSSQIYENPASIDGLSPFLQHYHGVPESRADMIQRAMASTVFRGCVDSSEGFMAAPLIQGIPTGVIVSEDDHVAPRGHINQMIMNWGVKRVLRTPTEHLRTYAKHPDSYENFVSAFVKGP